jgi:hypothetical protein
MSVSRDSHGSVPRKTAAPTTSQTAVQTGPAARGITSSRTQARQMIAQRGPHRALIVDWHGKVVP